MIRIFFAIVFLAVQTIIFAQPQNSTASPAAITIENINTEDFYEENLYLTGKWWGAREILSVNGIKFESIYKADTYSTIIGGNNRSTFYLDNIDVKFELDGAKLFGWNGSIFNIYFLGNNGGGIAEASGTAQGISNIEAFNTWKLYELWIDQSLFDNTLSVKLGLYDLNSEFDTRETSSLFINPSHGIGVDIAQSGQNGPSIFPNTSLALRIKYQPTESFYFQSALFDGVPGNPKNPNGTKIKFNKGDGLLSISEFGLTKSSDNFAEGYSKFALGAWFYTSRIEKFSNAISAYPTDYNYGVYAFAEKFLFGETIDKTQGLSAFLRVGYANESVNPFDGYFGAGLTYTGLFNGRDSEVLGFAVAAGHISKDYSDLLHAEGVELSSYEINFELTYMFELNNWISIQPNLQYVLNPVNCFNNNNAFITGMRATINF